MKDTQLLVLTASEMEAIEGGKKHGGHPINVNAKNVITISVDDSKTFTIEHLIIAVGNGNTTTTPV